MTKIIQYPYIRTKAEVNWVPPEGCEHPREVTVLGTQLDERVRSFKGTDVDILAEHDNKRNLAIGWLVLHADDQYVGEAVREWLGDEEWIYAAATKGLSGDVYFVAPPARHPHVLRAMAATQLPGTERFGAKQGFVTYKAGMRRFVSREEGMRIAKANGQLWRACHSGSYQGEDLW